MGLIAWEHNEAFRSLRINLQCESVNIMHAHSSLLQHLQDSCKTSLTVNGTVNKMCNKILRLSRCVTT